MNSNNDYLLAPAAKKNKRLRIDNFFLGLDTRRDQSVLPPAVSPYTYNFDFSSGALSDGCGLTDTGVATSLVTDIWRYSKGGVTNEEILMFAKDGYIFYVRDGKVNQLPNVRTSGKIYTSNYRLYGSDVLIIFSDSSPLIVWDGINAAYTVTNSPRISSMDTHEGLVFIADADGETIRYTSDLDPTNWNGPVSEGGSLRLADGRGRVNKVVSFLNYLYVFRDYGISRVTVRDEEPTSAGLYVSSGRIYGNTVTLCGSKVVFLAEDGLYEFDGLSTKRVLSGLNGVVMPDGNAKAAYSGGKYYLACRISFLLESADSPHFGSFSSGGSSVVGCETGMYVNNALIVYNPSDGTYSLSRGMDIVGLAGIAGVTYAVCGGKVAKVTAEAVCFNQPLKKLWQSPFSNLGSERVKLFKELYIETKGDLILSISTENGQQIMLARASDAPQRMRFSLKGRKVSVSIESYSRNAYVTVPTLIYNEL